MRPGIKDSHMGDSVYTKCSKRDSIDQRLPRVLSGKAKQSQMDKRCFSDGNV
jgi:hypothetical protein